MCAKIPLRRRTFKADADAVSSVDARIVLRGLQDVSVRIRITELWVGNDADPVVVRLVGKTLVLEVDVVDVDRVDWVDGGVQFGTVVWYLNLVVVVRVAAGARQEREVAQFRLFAETCATGTITVTKTNIKAEAYIP